MQGFKLTIFGIIAVSSDVRVVNVLVFAFVSQDQYLWA